MTGVTFHPAPRTDDVTKLLLKAYASPDLALTNIIDRQNLVGAQCSRVTEICRKYLDGMLLCRISQGRLSRPRPPRPPRAPWRRTSESVWCRSTIDRYPPGRPRF